MDQQTFNNQLEETNRAFRNAPKTMKQVSVETGIDRPNICRYVAYLRKRNKIAVVKKDICPVTRHSAQFFSTDPELIPKPGQAELFKAERCRV
ncbi:hypothetical protein [Rhodohalobacter sulfatireducens]|uniref:Winged helix-turn-helix domain-containing protein n=1 Tax=Rhodohalobacter sulfatireducens TaxID=2911366 RepID=A0ABS9KHQ3_9BACT|nr:hypothetical protein [Rhodohalobacter sulfatireducens]MCG2590389.1 hypothetical protein [Rhodohalobacter sulfatireducens]